MVTKLVRVLVVNPSGEPKPNRYVYSFDGPLFSDGTVPLATGLDGHVDKSVQPGVHKFGTYAGNLLFVSALCEVPGCTSVVLTINDNPCTAATCEDGDRCTNDTCDPVSGCSHVTDPSHCGDNGACPTPKVASQAEVVFQENWEACSDAWTNAASVETQFASDPTLHECGVDVGPRAQSLVAAGGEVVSFEGSWFHPIAIDPTSSYCLGAWIKWQSGRQPFISIKRYNSHGEPLGLNRIMGASWAGMSDGMGGLVLPLRDAAGWVSYQKALTLPADTSSLQIVDGLDPP